MRQYYQPTSDKQCGQRIQLAQLLLSIRSYFTVNCRYDRADELLQRMHFRPPQLLATVTKYHSMATTTNNSTDMQSPPVSGAPSFTKILCPTSHKSLVPNNYYQLVCACLFILIANTRCVSGFRRKLIAVEHHVDVHSRRRCELD